MTKLAFCLAAALPFAAGFAVTPASAQQQPAQRIAEIIVDGNDPGPRSTDDEVVVCARRPEADRFRIPEAYRGSGTRQERTPWAQKARTLETVSDTGAQSCSAVGPGGYTGCLEQLIRESARARAEEAQGAVPPE